MESEALESDALMGSEFFDAQPQTLVPNITFNSPVVSLTQVIAAQYYINANFQSPAGNAPVTNNNMVFVFEGGPPIVTSNSPVGSGTVQGTQQQGNATATPSGDPFYSEDYVLAYSVGPAVTPKGGSTTYPNVAATVYLPGGVGSGEPMQFFGSALSFVPDGVSPTAIQWQYQFVPGTNPPGQSAFIGLWPSNLTTPYGATPAYTAPILNKNQSSGKAIMANLKLAIGSQYTAALYTSGYPLTPGAAPPNCIAAWMTFTLQAPSS